MPAANWVLPRAIGTVRRPARCIDHLHRGIVSVSSWFDAASPPPTNEANLASRMGSVGLRKITPRRSTECEISAEAGYNRRQRRRYEYLCVHAANGVCFVVIEPLSGTDKAGG